MPRLVTVGVALQLLLQLIGQVLGNPDNVDVDAVDARGIAAEAETAHALEDEEPTDQLEELRAKLAALKLLVDDRGVHADFYDKFREIERQVESWESVPRSRRPPPLAETKPQGNRRPPYMYFLLAAVPAMHLMRFFARRYRTPPPPSGRGADEVGRELLRDEAMKKKKLESGKRKGH
eukprot:TRINITY_DN76687_c0_g1_i1.p1 TRINITY_DN76687_c0_g1~~TRINITY_DN76687_c0_g1_i1.p1  ORF type:complete len:178 (+),score=37.14 TRINITY_DN76687_c0_g1_i1:85-618(+)